MDNRRHDVDWLRVLALALLIVFHGALSFQPWAHNILFIQNPDPLPRIWFPMRMLDIWRIPLLFLISGMGAYFALLRRDKGQFLQERAKTIFLPFVVGYFLICPLSVYLSALYFDKPLVYTPNAGHLWFLLNIGLYVLLLMPLLFVLSGPGKDVMSQLVDGLLSRPFGIFLVFLTPLITEVVLLEPEHFSTYSKGLLGLPTAHGFWFGFVCFMLGYFLISRKEVFWSAVQHVRHIAIMLALILYSTRLFVFQFQEVPNVMIATESGCWMLAVLAYGSLYLNRPSNYLSYLSKAVFPVYIAHFPVLFGLAYFLFPLELTPIVKLPLLLAGTFAASFLLYEILKRLPWIGPLVGIRAQREKS